jgi:hypothetical protein
MIPIIIISIIIISLITYIIYRYTSKNENTKENFEYQIETSKNKINVYTMSGGGLISHSINFSVISNLLIELRNIKNDQNLKLHDLLCKVHTIGANSGGSWLVTMLFYDIEFNYDINTKLTNIENISNVYNDIYLFWLKLQWNQVHIEDYLQRTWIPRPLAKWLNDLLGGYLRYSTEPWYNTLKNIFLLGRQYLNTAKMSDCLEEFKNKEIIYQSGIITDARLGGYDIGLIEPNPFSEKPYISYSFKNPHPNCQGPLYCRPIPQNNFYISRNIWREDGKYCCSDCCRNNNNSQTCPMQIPFTFSKKNIQNTGDFSKLMVQYFAYNNDIENNPDYPDNVEEEVSTDITFEDFKNYDTSKELVIGAASSSSSFIGFASSPCQMKRLFINTNIGNTFQTLGNRVLELTKKASPILLLNSNTDKKIYGDNNILLDNMDMSRSVVDRDNWRDVLEIDSKYKILKVSDGGIVDDSGIVSAIKSAQRRCCKKVLNIFSVIQQGVGDKVTEYDKKHVLSKLSALGFLFNFDLSDQDTGYIKSEQFPNILKTDNIDNSIPRQGFNISNLFGLVNSGIFDKKFFNNYKVYPANDEFITDEEKTLGVCYINYNNLETIENKFHGVKKGTKVNLHIFFYKNSRKNYSLVPYKLSDINNFKILCEKSSKITKTLIDSLKNDRIVDIISLFDKE